MWYCSACKEHRQAIKTMELYTTPRIMVITFKRFKRGKSRFSIFGGDEQGDFDDCEKMDT